MSYWAEDTLIAFQIPQIAKDRWQMGTVCMTSSRILLPPWHTGVVLPLARSRNHRLRALGIGIDESDLLSRMSEGLIRLDVPVALMWFSSVLETRR